MKLEENKRRRYLEALKTNHLLKNLKEEKISVIVDNLLEEKWPRHTCSIHRSKNLTRFYFIISGRLKIYKFDPSTGREFTLFLLTKNDVFDILCLLDEGEHDVFFETIDEVLVLSTTVQTMRKWINDYSGIKKNLLPYMGKRIRTMEENAADIILHDISMRLAKLILTHINSESKELELINDLSNEELASLIGSTRAVVNRHLQEFKHDGILKIGRKNLKVQDLQLLLHRIEQKRT